MEITNIKVIKTSSVLGENKVKAYVSLTFDDSFVVGDIKIIDGSKGLFLAFPSRPRKDKNRVNVAYPIKSEVREKITAEVLKVYNNSEN